MTVHQILQTFQFGVDLETRFSHLEMFCLDLNIDVLCWGSWVSLEVGEVVDVEVLLLRRPSREKGGAIGHGLHGPQQWRPVLRNRRLTRLPNLIPTSARNFQTRHEHAVVLINWRVRDLKSKADAVGLALVQLLVP